MADRAKVAPKTYVSKYASFSSSFMVGEGAERVSDTIRFVGGEFTTAFKDEQEHLEGLPMVSVKPDAKVALAAKAKDLRAAAVKANALAKDAEDALAALDKPAKTAAA